MKKDKTYTLRIQPIIEITDEQMEVEMLATNGHSWCSGYVAMDRNGDYYCESEDFGIIFNVTHFAVLPKDE